MWWICGVVVLAGVCSAIELPGLAKHSKDRWTFAVLILLGTGLGLALGLHVRLPNPLDWIAAIFHLFGEWAPPSPMRD